jgi:hypothetical protein
VCVCVRGKSLGINVAHFFIFVCAKNVCVRALGTRLSVHKVSDVILEYYSMYYVLPTCTAKLTPRQHTLPGGHLV